MNETQPSNSALEIIKYIVSKLSDYPHFTAYTIQKVLFTVDFTLFREYGEAITGYHYIKHAAGPFSPQFVEDFSHLIARNQIARVASPTSLLRYVLLGDVYVNLFSATQIIIVDSVIEGVKKLSPEDTGDLDRAFVGWRDSRIGEEIPVRTSLIIQEELTFGEMAYFNNITDKEEYTV